jgi:hypothetical protein
MLQEISDKAADPLHRSLEVNLETSVFLACLFGPVLAIIGAGMLFNAQHYLGMTREIMRSPALVFMIGHAALPSGLAKVLVHNIWVTDWPVLITILGWLGVIGGILRILMPQRIAAASHHAVANINVLRCAGLAWLLIGLLLSYFGFWSAQ